jgi:hypothetical protein
MRKDLRSPMRLPAASFPVHWRESAGELDHCGYREPQEQPTGRAPGVTQGEAAKEVSASGAPMFDGALRS